MQGDNTLAAGALTKDAAAAQGSPGGLAHLTPPSTERASPPDWLESYFKERLSDLVRVALYAGAVDGHEAKDAVQDVMVKLIRAGKWDFDDHRHAYVCRAIKNQIFDYLKSRNRRPLQPLGHEQESIASGAAHDMDEDEYRQYVDEMFAVLPPAQYRVMRLFYDGYDTEVIAEHLGKSEATIRSNLRHARQKLQPMWAEKFQNIDPTEPHGEEGL